MFRLLKLSPPHGWRAVIWELAIVTLGVLIALAAQQWVEARSWTAKAGAARQALRTELSEHHVQAVEWRVVAPCIDAQLALLEQRVMASGARLDPAPAYSELYNGDQTHTYALRTPLRPYGDSVWQATNSEGISSFLRPAERLQLGWHYEQANDADSQNEQMSVLISRLAMLTKPVGLDTGVRTSLLQQLAELRGHNRWMTIRTGQLVDHIVKLGMQAPLDQISSFVSRSFTAKHCRSRRLPMLSLDKALVPTP